MQRINLVTHGISLLSQRPHTKFELVKKLEHLCHKQKTRSRIRIARFEKKKGFEPHSKELLNTRTKAQASFDDCSEAVETSIAELISSGYLDDSEYALWHIAQRSKFRPRSKLEISSELRSKGVARNLIHSALTDSDFCDAKECLKLVKTKTQRQMSPSKIKTQLVRRGFQSTMVQTLLLAAKEEEEKEKATRAKAKAKARENDEEKEKEKEKEGTPL